MAPHLTATWRVARLILVRTDGLMAGDPSAKIMKRNGCKDIRLHDGEDKPKIRKAMPEGPSPKRV
jgi:hypothetical protein